ncbi:MAG: tetratricopeptide repeat protein, partial [Rhodospirillales bacterium]|nr:tetratricopeptide repeat protein [Rhodospirillales bacterium]
NSPDVQSDHAEMLVMQANGTVTPVAEQAFKAVLVATPDNPAARYYLALARMQAGEPKRAIEGFQALLAILPSDSPLRGQIGAQIAEAAKQAGIPTPALEKGSGPSTQTPEASTAASSGTAAPPASAGGPSEADMKAAAGMTDAQREAMVRSMVEQLAAKQAADPDNFDGWMRLGRAYAVLKEMDKAAAAYDKARTLRPDDITVPEAEAQALMTGYKPGDKLPPRAVELFKTVLAKDPERPAALWYLGLAAAMDGDKATARQHWTALHDLLPANSPERKMVENALATLPKPADATASPADASASPAGK